MENRPPVAEPRSAPAEPVRLHPATLRWVALRCAVAGAANMDAVKQSAKGSDRIALWATIRTLSELQTTLTRIAVELEGEPVGPSLLVDPNGDRIA